MSLPAVPVSQSPEDKFREFLTSRSPAQRLTEQQREMVRFIFAQHHHFDADQLMEGLKQAGLVISRATVYRTLTKLVEAGLLRKIELGPRMCYEHDYGYPHHEHLHCARCNKMIEFQSPKIEEALRDICAQQAFKASGYTLLIRGICAECTKAKVSRRLLDLV
ncbi:MAG: transcriptional repressor [Planctomycetia bacterium]|nr:transcriptional repressor [Planctomycetia bacterium]